MKIWMGLFLAVALAGCGGSSDFALQNGSSVAAAPGISGRILDESGQPLADVQVVVHERTTNRRTRVFSDAQGVFQLDLAAGTYDVGLDRKGDVTTTNSFYGPIEVSTALDADFVLHSSAGRPADQVFGKVMLQPGIPAANRKVSLRPGTLLGDATAERLGVASTTTAVDGTFALSVGSPREVALDVEFFNADGTLDEWVDVAKRDKPCYVEVITEQSPAENRLRCTEVDDPTPVNASSVLMQQQQAAAPSVVPFAEARVLSGGEAKLAQGLIPVGAPKTRLSEMIIGGPPDDQSNEDLWKVTKQAFIEVNTNAAWFYGYAVHIKANRSTDWVFIDENGDSYQLWISITSFGHQVSYDSEKPNINRVDFDLSTL